MDRILGDSLAFAARALYWSHSAEPVKGALLLLATAEAYEKGLETPLLVGGGLRGPSLWKTPVVPLAGSTGPCESQGLIHSLPLRPEVTGLEKLCHSFWVGFLRNHGWMGRTPKKIEFSQKI